jgi:hypothetical protein
VQSQSVGDGRISVRHREFVADIKGSLAFSAIAFSINPGLYNTFPWLAQIAAQFESYKFRSLNFIFLTQKSTNTSGAVMLGVDYDASDSAPQSKIQLMSYNGAVRSSVWNECSNVCKTSDLLKFGVQRYIRSGGLQSNLDIKTYDIGRLFVGTIGCVDDSLIGELYVEYDVEFLTPQTDISAIANSLSVNFVGNLNVSDASFMGDAPIRTGGLDVTAAVNTITFNRPGQYLLTVNIAGTGILAVGVMTGNVIRVQVSGTTPFLTGTTGLYEVFAVNCINAGENLIISYAAATTVTASTVRIATYASALALI